MTNFLTAFAVLAGCVTFAAGTVQSFAGPQVTSGVSTSATDTPADDSPIVAPVKRVAPQMPENKAKVKAITGQLQQITPAKTQKQKAAAK